MNYINSCAAARQSDAHTSTGGRWDELTHGEASRPLGLEVPSVSPGTPWSTPTLPAAKSGRPILFFTVPL